KRKSIPTSNQRVGGKESGFGAIKYRSVAYLQQNSVCGRRSVLQNKRVDRRGRRPCDSMPVLYQSTHQKRFTQRRNEGRDHGGDLGRRGNARGRCLCSRQHRYGSDGERLSNIASPNVSKVPFGSSIANSFCPQGFSSNSPFGWIAVPTS